MQFSLFAWSAFAATTLAQLPTSIAPNESGALIGILLTALPASELSQAIANPTAFSSEIASSFSAHETPGWFQSLPNGVKTLLVPAAGANSSAAQTTAAANLTSSALGALPTGNLTSGIFGNGTSITHRSITLVSSTQSSQSTSGSTSASTSPSSGLAAAPTAAYGAGIAGAIGIIGLLAL